MGEHLSISRASQVITRVNKSLEDRSNHLRYSEPEAALAAVSLVADRYWADARRQEFVDRAYEVAAFLGGASINQISKDRSYRHIPSPQDYTKTHLGDSIRIVSDLAASIMETPEVSSVVSNETRSEYEVPHTSIRSTVELLHEAGIIEAGYMLGMLVVFDEVPHDTQKTAVLYGVTTKWLQEKVRRAPDPSPYITRVIGDTRDAVVARKMQGVINDEMKRTTDRQAAERFVRSKIASELAAVFAQRVY